MSAELYEFEDVTVDLRRMEIRRAGEALTLEPKSFDVLRHLLENRDRLVTKDELLDTVWRDTFVTPNVLTRAVAQLRKALGDDAHEARYIETISKRGYRFIAPVMAASDGQGDATAVVRPQEYMTPVAGSGRSWRRLAILAVAVAIAAAAAVASRFWLGSRKGAGAATTVSTPRRLTATRDSYGFPAISPDGSAVAYVSDRTGINEIVVVGLAPGSNELRITSDGGDNVEPAFSPDGRWLAYRSRKRRGVWIVPSTGGAPRQVAEFGSGPSWSPDSRTIVFTSHADTLSSQAVLWTVGVDQAPPVQLTKLGQPPGGHLSPTWSHDGRLILFRVGRHEANEVWVVEPGTGAARRLATLSRWSEPRFAPDDRAVYWIGTTAERNDCLMRLKLDDQGHADGTPEMILPFQGEGVQRLTIARDGTAVFLWQRLSVNLFSVDIGAAGATTPPIQLTADEEATSTYPHYSHTGRIAYERRASGGPVTAWVMDEDGRNKEPISAGFSASVRLPQWDAQAARVFALVEEGPDRQPYFGWIDLATRRLTRIPVPSSGSDTLPKLAPDGQRLAFHRVAGDGVLNVWVQPLDGGPPRQVTFDREAASYPSWSPDGKWLSVQLKRGEDSQIGVLPADGGPVEQLTTGRGIRWAYSFAPDNDRIAFSGLSPEVPSNIYSVSRSTKEVKQLTRLTSGARFPAWSPRGDRIVFASPQHSRSLWTLQLPR